MSGRARMLRYFPVNMLLSRHLGEPHQPERRPEAARDGPGVIDEPALRAASAGAAIVTNPYEGIERWFEPGREQQYEPNQ